MEYDTETKDLTIKDFKDRAKEAFWNDERIQNIIDNALDESNDFMEVITDALCTIDDELEGFDADDF